MRKFKNNVSDGWLFGQEMRLWRNFARNWDRDVEDCDFFDPFANTANAWRIAALAKESEVKRDTKKPARIGF